MCLSHNSFKTTDLRDPYQECLFYWYQYRASKIQYQSGYSSNSILDTNLLLDWWHLISQSWPAAGCALFLCFCFLLLVWNESWLVASCFRSSLTVWTTSWEKIWRGWRRSGLTVVSGTSGGKRSDPVCLTLDWITILSKHKDSAQLNHVSWLSVSFFIALEKCLRGNWLVDISFL